MYFVHGGGERLEGGGGGGGVHLCVASEWLDGEFGGVVGGVGGAIVVVEGHVDRCWET